MLLARIVGTVVATRKDPRLVSNKLLLARPVDPKGKADGNYLVAIDTVDAGVGETVLIVSGSSARLAAGIKDTPVDAFDAAKAKKLLEEAGSPAISPAQRDELGAIATRALTKLGYRNAGTLEFLYQDGQFAFIEMNTRLQVEHPVTEMITGMDLVREQIRVAEGHGLSVRFAARARGGQVDDGNHATVKLHFSLLRGRHGAPACDCCGCRIPRRWRCSLRARRQGRC